MRVLGIALLCVAAAAALAPAQRAQDAGGPPPATAGGGVQKLNAPATRFAFVDGRLLAQGGVKLEKDGEALADLRAFGESLNVEIIDVEKLKGVIFVADGRADLTEAFLAAWKARPSRSAPLTPPDIKVPPVTAAFVNTDAFADPQAGINKLVKAFRSLEAEFKPRRDEILHLREQLEKGRGDRKRLEDEIKRKQAAGQEALDQRLRELAGPIYQDIGSSLTPFCKRHGIAVLFDASKLRRTGRLPPFDRPLPPDMPDVTAAFVEAYNKGALLDNILIK
jgi:hypothetical protein